MQVGQAEEVGGKVEEKGRNESESSGSTDINAHIMMSYGVPTIYGQAPAYVVS